MEKLWTAGFGTGMGLIVAIGAQNVFVLTKGMSRRHLLAVPLVCFLCDVVLMTVGVAGVGSLLALEERFLSFSALGGAAFLLWYGYGALRTALSGKTALAVGETDGEAGLRRVLAATLAVTLLNPHVYLDCLVLMGGIGSRYPHPDRWYFLSGVLSASFLWFFSLSLFGRVLAPVLGRPRVWRFLQAGVCGLLWWQAAGLVSFALEKF